MAKTYLEPEEIELMEGTPTNLRDQLLIRMLFRTGCRVSEALGIAVDDIDFERGTVTIQTLKQKVRRICPHCGSRLSRTASFCPGCGIRVEQAAREESEDRRVRTVPLDPKTLTTLRFYTTHGGPVQVNGRQLLFGITRRHAWGVVARAAKDAGIPELVNPETGKTRGVSPHRLRDALAVHAARVDDSADALRMLQEQLGHASFNTTARYRKVAGVEQREWYDRLWKDERDDRTE
jgi:integrase/recombinase XerD